MLNYLYAELFRIKKSISIKSLLVAGILVPAILAYIFVYINKEMATDSEYSYFYLLRVLIMPGSILISFISILATKKPKEIYKIYFSYGLERGQVVLYDFLLFQGLTALLGTFIYIVTLAINFILALLWGYDPYREFLIFSLTFVHTLFLQINLNTLVYLFFYWFEHKLLLALAFNLSPIIYMIFLDIGRDYIGPIDHPYLNYLSESFNYILSAEETLTVSPRVYPYFIVAVVASLGLNWLFLKRRSNKW